MIEIRLPPATAPLIVGATGGRAVDRSLARAIGPRARADAFCSRSSTSRRAADLGDQALGKNYLHSSLRDTFDGSHE
jgi:hypothetical protein